MCIYCVCARGKVALSLIDGSHLSARHQSCLQADGDTRGVWEICSNLFTKQFSSPRLSHPLVSSLSWQTEHRLDTLHSTEPNKPRNHTTLSKTEPFSTAQAILGPLTISWYFCNEITTYSLALHSVFDRVLYFRLLSI